MSENTTTQIVVLSVHSPNTTPGFVVVMNFDAMSLLFWCQLFVTCEWRMPLSFGHIMSAYTVLSLTVIGHLTLHFLLTMVVQHLEVFVQIVAVTLA